MSFSVTKKIVVAIQTTDAAVEWLALLLLVCIQELLGSVSAWRHTEPVSSSALLYCSLSRYILGLHITLGKGSTDFPKIWGPTPVSRCHKGDDVKQVPYCEPTILERHL